MRVERQAGWQHGIQHDVLGVVRPEIFQGHGEGDLLRDIGRRGIGRHGHLQVGLGWFGGQIESDDRGNADQRVDRVPQFDGERTGKPIHAGRGRELNHQQLRNGTRPEGQDLIDCHEIDSGSGGSIDGDGADGAGSDVPRGTPHLEECQERIAPG